MWFRNIYKLGLTMLFIVYYVTLQLVNGAEITEVIDKFNSTADIDDDYYVYYQGVQGKPGVDFPVFSAIPRTSFNCRDVESGYYADLETKCQVFHICNDGRKISFLCPNGTIFQQSDLICEWWFKVNCTNSPNLYEESAEQLREDTIKRKSSRRVVKYRGKILDVEESRNFNIQTETNTNLSRNQNNISTINHNSQKSRRKNILINQDTAKIPQSPYVDSRGNKKFSIQTRTTERNTKTYDVVPAKLNFEKKIITKELLVSHSKFNQTVNENKKRNLISRKPIQQNISDEYSSENIPSQRYQQSNTPFVIQNSYFQGNNKGDIKSTNAKQLDTPSQGPNAISDSKSIGYEETQITQETAGFYKTSLNNLQAERKLENIAHPNHKETYSEIKTPQVYYSTQNSNFEKLTTPQTINNGKPFVGEKIQATSTARTINSSIAQKNSYVNQGIGTQTDIPVYNIANTYINCCGNTKDAENVSVPLSTLKSRSNFENENENVNRLPKKISHASSTLGYFREHFVNISAPDSNIAYVKFSSNKPQLLQLRTSFNQNLVSSTGVPYSTFKPSTSKYSETSTYKYEPSRNSNAGNNAAVTEFVNIGTNPTFETINTETVNNLPSPSTTESSSTYHQETTISNKGYVYTSNNLRTDNSVQNYTSGFYVTKPTSNGSVSIHSATITPNINFYPINKNVQYYSTSSPPLNILIPTNKIFKPKPFELVTEANVYSTLTTKSSVDNPKVSPTLPTEKNNLYPLPTYKLSSASPFSTTAYEYPQINNVKPTSHTTQSALNTPQIRSAEYENIDNMINALMNIATAKPSTQSMESPPRPGLVIPPSASPQTLHTLAVYFANALDDIVSTKESNTEDNASSSGTDAISINSLLTHSTVSKYNNLFNEKNANAETTETSTENEKQNKDLGTDNSENDEQTTTPRVRQLARVFTQALSAYLDDPDTFKKVLYEVRPTEPPLVEQTGGEEDEVLNYSDANVQTSNSQLSTLPTSPSIPNASPTWGYIISFNTPKSTEVKNTLNSEKENLQGADSQSFVSQFNNLLLKGKEKPKHDKEYDQKTTLPEDHWTTSSDVTKLWQTTLSVNPITINSKLETTEPTNIDLSQESTEKNIYEASTEDTFISTEGSQIRYDLDSVPKVELNATQVHKLLREIMNSTDESHKLLQILKKLNTTQEEFLSKMKEIEANPLTRRLILLLISECGINATKEIERSISPTISSPEYTSSDKRDNAPKPFNTVSREDRSNSDLKTYVGTSLKDDQQDARALQLLNSLYTIASRWGK